MLDRNNPPISVLTLASSLECRILYNSHDNSPQQLRRYARNAAIEIVKVRNNIFLTDQMFDDVELDADQSVFKAKAYTYGNTVIYDYERYVFPATSVFLCINSIVQEVLSGGYKVSDSYAWKKTALQGCIFLSNSVAGLLTVCGAWNAFRSIGNCAALSAKNPLLLFAAAAVLAYTSIKVLPNVMVKLRSTEADLLKSRLVNDILNAVHDEERLRAI